MDAKETVYIMGYSLDAVIEAVRRKMNGETVHFLATARLGEPLDMFNDMLSSNTVALLNVVSPIPISYTEYHDPRFLYIPYDKVRIKNTNNGIIQFPLNKNSFDDSEEWKAVCESFKKEAVYSVLVNKGNSPSKLVSTMKSNMPSTFVDTFCKAMGMTRWRGIQLSHLTMIGFNYEYPFKYIERDHHETFYKPDMTYEEICNGMLLGADIPITNVPLDACGKMIRDRAFTDPLVIMDNRIDSFLKYVCGRFDRIRMYSEEVKMPSQLATGRNGLYYTPYSTEFWGVEILDDRAFTLRSELVNTLYDDYVSAIPLTRTNAKMYNQYESMVKFYGPKKMLDVRQRVETMVK